MTLTAWRFRGTEGADAAVLKIKQLGGQKIITVQDAAVIRWPQYAAAPQAQEHVTDEGSKVSSLVSKVKRAGIESSMLESVKGDLTPGDSALVLLSADATIETVAEAFEGQNMELIRSDLSVEQEDKVRAAFKDREAHHDEPPGAGGEGQ